MTETTFTQTTEENPGTIEISNVLTRKQLRAIEGEWRRQTTGRIMAIFVMPTPEKED